MRDWRQEERAARAAELMLLEGVPAQDVAQELGIGRTQVFGLLKYARESGLVHVHPEPERWMEPVRDPELEGNLLTAFGRERLQRAIVVEASPRQAGVTSFSLCADSSLHRLLGKVGALYLRDVLRRGDRLGIGGGRATASLVTELSGAAPPLPDGCRVVSLSGGLNFRTVPERHVTPASADLAASALAAALGVPASARAPLSVWSAPPFSAERLTPLSITKEDSSHPDQVPNIAIVGLGNVFRESRHFVISGELEPSHTPAPLVSVLSKIRATMEGYDPPTEVDRSVGHYYPLLEVLNRIFIVPAPHPVSSVSSIDMDHLRDDVEALNEYAVGIPLDRFKSIDMRIGIAGGLHKAFQIRHAIALGLVNQIVVDSLTATAILSGFAAENAVREASGPLRPTRTQPGSGQR